MKCIICGSRNIHDYDLLKRVVRDSGFKITEVVSGCANGADKLGERWAKENGATLTKFEPDWNRYGSHAGLVRNRDMIKFLLDSGEGCVIALWDGKSKGTEHTIKLAREAKIKLFIAYPPDQSE